MKYCLFIAGALLTVSVQAQSISNLSAQQAKVEKQRAELKAQINKLNSRITQQEASRKDVLDDLRESESAISEISRKLDRLLDQEQEAKDNLAAVRQEEKIQRDILAAHIEDLAEQIYATYTSGMSPWSALLSGKDAQKINRDLGYLSYISKARARSVEALKKETERLADVGKKAQAYQRNITQLAKDASKAKADLEKEQKNYQAKLAKIEKDINKRRQEAGKLQADDERLTRLIADIEKNIRTQREALRQAEIQRQKQAEERRRALAVERERQAAQAAAQAKAAQEQLARAQALREQARKEQMAAIERQRETTVRLQQVQNEFGLAISPQQQEQAKAALQLALNEQQNAQKSMQQARQQAEDAEIERAKARLAQEKAREAQRLLLQARKDERRAKQVANADLSNGLVRGAPWPLRGNLRGRFGQTRPDTGDIWRGILIDASTGAPVKAIASGHVVFANWVRGFGNLIIVDHGNNYLSVYGYNQSLSRSVGDTVKAGQVIARAGSTGGQVEPALYFEIRQGNVPVDPLQWLAK